MLGVGRQQSTAAFFEFRQHHGTRGNQCLFVGQCKILAGSNGRQGGEKACTAHDARDHEVRRVPGRSCIQSVWATHQMRLSLRLLVGWQCLQPLVQLRQQRFIGQCHHLGTVLLNLFHQQRQVSACCEGHHPELVREILNDLEGLGAD